MKLKTRPKVLDDEPLVKAVDAATDESTTYEDRVVVMPPKSIMRVKIHVRSVTKARPRPVVPEDY